MSATLPRPDVDRTIVLPDVDRYPLPPPDQGWRDRPPRWTAAVAVLAVVALGAVIVLIAFVFPPWDTATEPTTPPAADVQLTEPADTAPTTTPTVPAAPAPVIAYGDEPRANWDLIGVTAGDRLDVFTGPGAQSPILTTLPADLAELESTGRTATVDGVLWRELVIPGDGTGWVLARHLTATVPPPAAPAVTYGSETPAFYDVTGIASTDALNVRTGPGTTHPVIARLDHDATGVESTGQIARVDGALWRQVALPAGAVGWVSAAYLTPTPAGPVIVYGTELRANWGVVGVRADDVLEVHRTPGPAAPIVAELAPDAAELESTGRIARVDGVLWRELVIPGDGTGWVNATFLTETAPPAPAPTSAPA